MQGFWKCTFQILFPLSGWMSIKAVIVYHIQEIISKSWSYLVSHRQFQNLIGTSFIIHNINILIERYEEGWYEQWTTLWQALHLSTVQLPESWIQIFSQVDIFFALSVSPLLIFPLFFILIIRISLTENVWSGLEKEFSLFQANDFISWFLYH